jgi:excisionase family DNA binding protein
MTDQHRSVPLSISVREAARLLGMGDTAAYEAAKRGEIPTVPIGRRLHVPTARFLAKFGLEPEAYWNLYRGDAA